MSSCVPVLSPHCSTESLFCPFSTKKFSHSISWLHGPCFVFFWYIYGFVSTTSCYSAILDLPIFHEVLEPLCFKIGVVRIYIQQLVAKTWNNSSLTKKEVDFCFQVMVQRKMFQAWSGNIPYFLWSTVNLFKLPLLWCPWSVAFSTFSMYTFSVSRRGMEKRNKSFSFKDTPQEIDTSLSLSSLWM